MQALSIHNLYIPYNNKQIQKISIFVCIDSSFWLSKNNSLNIGGIIVGAGKSIDSRVL